MPLAAARCEARRSPAAAEEAVGRQNAVHFADACLTKSGPGSGSGIDRWFRDLSCDPA